jgi:outer membrane protein TolC
MRLIMWCWAWLFLAVATGAQTSKPERRSVSLTECLRLALKHNLDLQIERYSPEIAQYTLSGSFGYYDPIFTLGVRESDDNFPQEVDPKKPGVDYAYELKDTSFGPSLGGQLPTGLSYDIVGAADAPRAWTFGLPRSNEFPPGGTRQTNEYTGDVTVALRQPLLRNFWIDAARQRISIEKRNLKISELALRQQIMNVVTKVQLTYYDLVFAREQVKVQQKALELVQQLLRETRRRVEVGDLPPLDEKQAESQVETTQSALLAAEQTLLEHQNLLKSVVSDDFRAWPDVELEPSEGFTQTAVPVDRDASWQAALQKRPDLLEFRLELEKKNITVRYQYNQLFPALDLVGSYGARARRQGLGDMLDDLEDTRSPSFSYGVVLSVPLSNRSARNSYKASRAAKQQAELQLKKLEEEILIQIDLAAKIVPTHFRRVNSTHQARVYAEAALAAEQTKLQNGASTSLFVLQFQRILTDARSAEIRALADYNKALVQLAFSDGSILEKSGLEVEVK